MRTVKHRLNKEQQAGLFIKLAKSLALLNNPEESAKFLKDLLSESEIFMLARRLQIAELLVEGWTYEKIREELKVGWRTIAKVQTWLALYGEGYRTVISRSSKQQEEKQESRSGFAQLKRRYPAYFWPQLLLEEIVKNANRREKERLRKVVEQLRDKTALSKQLTKLLQ